MTKKETKKVDDVEAFKIALALCGIAVDTHAAELIIETYEGFKKKGPSFSVADVTKIKTSLIRKYSKVAIAAEKSKS